MPDAIQQAVVVTDQTTPNSRTRTGKLALFDANGNPWNGSDATYDVLVTATAIGTAAKVVSTAEPKAGQLVFISFAAGNSAASATVAFAGGAARAVLLGGVAPTGAELAVAAGGVVGFFFDGTSLHQLGLQA